MSRILTLLPELTGSEQIGIAQMMASMSDDEAQQFAHVYRARRRDPSTMLVLTLVGLFAIGGLQRFYIGQTGMGILYLLTGGLCAIGTILDAINHQSLAADYNLRQAQEVAAQVRMALGGPSSLPALPASDLDNSVERLRRLGGDRSTIDV